VDGVLANIHVSGSSDGSLRWTNDTFGTVARITVTTPGIHTVSIWGREDGFEVDRILITSSTRVPTGDGSVVVPFPMINGEVLIEGEAFHSQASNGSSATWTMIANPLASGGGSIDLRPDSGTVWTANVTTTSPRVDYQVNFTQAGTFTVWLRGSGENGGNDSCFVGVDGVLANIHVSGSSNGSLLWTNGTFGTVARITVATPGVHTVSIWGREDGFEVDRILITSGTRVPTGDGETTRWVATWGSGQQLTEPSNLPPSPGLANNTLRQFVYVSIGGTRLRVRFSNLFGNGPVTLNSVHVAVPTTGSGIDTATDRALSFSGSPSVTIPTGQELWSDAFDFALAAQSRFAVTINFGSAPSDVTGHPGSRTTSYLQSGNAVSAATLSGPSTEHWYHLTAVNVAADAPAAALVTLGDSITDGRGSTTNGNNRWPDVLSRALRLNGPTASVAVVNQGIGGNGILGGLGPSAVSRFQRDVLAVSGVKWVIVMEGVNDIGGAANTQIADQLISAYQSFITQAHAANLRIYGVPILPFGGSSYDTPDHETARQTVNTWIRTSGTFDAVIDLDAVVRDPLTPTALLLAYDSGDHLHPSVAGHQALGEGIPLTLFAP
jgi:lysophospholipase L1-like esterase